MVIREKCGVIGISSQSSGVDVPAGLYSGLMALQHRGQESAGLATLQGGKIRVKKAMGLVNDTFSYEDLEQLSSTAGIGHVRYSTTGTSTLDNAQPMVLKANGLQAAISFNGNIVNYDELKGQLGGSVKFSCTSDTELILRLFGLELKKHKAPKASASSGPDYFSAMKAVMQKLEGAYAFVFLLSDGTLIAARDPQGFKPFCLGRKKTLVGEYVFVASETCALDALDAQFDRDVKPGEVVVVRGTDVQAQVLMAPKPAHCMFEYVYFARPDSAINGRSVYAARESLGRTLGQLFKGKADVVIPVPDSGRSAAHGFSQATGIPFAEGLIKNRYIHRTFIMPSDASRKTSIKLKLAPVKSLIEGKRVAVVDDSIVRGNTTRKLVKMLRSAGATEVHLLVSCPPIVAPCYMGIDFPTYRELIAHNRNLAQISGELGADSLTYMTVEGLVDSIGLGDQLCLGCLTDKYPTERINAYAKLRKQVENRFNIAVLASGRGSNLQSIIDRIEDKSLNVHLSAVISDHDDAFALQRAEKHGFDALFIDPKAFPGKDEYEQALLKALEARQINLVVLAGYLRILGPTLLKPYAGRIINIHPTLLPKFKGCMGADCQKLVLEAKETEAGCSVHLVTEDVDGGAILGQRRVAVKEGDTPELLAERVLKEEHLLLPEIIKQFQEGKHGCC